MNLYKKIYTITVLILLCSFSVFNILNKKDDIRQKITSFEVPDNMDSLKLYTSQIDGTLTDKLVCKFCMSEIYGSIYRLLGKNEEHGFRNLRDKDGFLYRSGFTRNCALPADKLARRIRRMKDALPPESKLIFMLYPSKYNKAWTKDYYGIPYKDLNGYADDLLRYLRRYDVDYLDYRQLLKESSLDLTEIFYRTDTRWKVPAEFFAAGELISYLNTKYGDKLDINGYYRNIDNYVVERYEDIYLGNQGKESGLCYAQGADSYTLLYPKFETDYKYSAVDDRGKVHEKRGDILDTLINVGHLKYNDIYKRNLNGVYIEDAKRSGEIENMLLKGRDMPKAVFIRNTYSSAVAVFASAVFEEVDLIYSGSSSTEKFEKELGKKQYKYVFVSFETDELEKDIFPFFTEEKLTGEGGSNA